MNPHHEHDHEKFVQHLSAVIAWIMISGAALIFASSIAWLTSLYL